jgi:hypothetical protein
MWSHLPSRAPRGRRDADRCCQHRYGLRSEHGEWPPQRARRLGLRRCEMDRAPCPLRFIGGHLAPGPGSPTLRAIQAQAHTPGRPAVCVFDTHRLLRCSEETWLCTILGRTGDCCAGGLAGAESERYFSRVSPVLRCAGHHLPAATLLALGSPDPWVAVPADPTPPQFPRTEIHLLAQGRGRRIPSVLQALAHPMAGATG